MESSSYADARGLKLSFIVRSCLIVSKVSEVLALNIRERYFFVGAIEFGVLCERSASVRIEFGSRGLIISIVMYCIWEFLRFFCIMNLVSLRKTYLDLLHF